MERKSTAETGNKRGNRRNRGSKERRVRPDKRAETDRCQNPTETRGATAKTIDPRGHETLLGKSNRNHFDHKSRQSGTKVAS